MAGLFGIHLQWKPPRPYWLFLVEMHHGTGRISLFNSSMATIESNQFEAVYMDEASNASKKEGSSKSRPLAYSRSFDYFSFLTQSSGRFSIPLQRFPIIVTIIIIWRAGMADAELHSGNTIHSVGWQLHGRHPVRVNKTKQNISPLRPWLDRNTTICLRRYLHRCSTPHESTEHFGVSDVSQRGLVWGGHSSLSSHRRI